MDIFGLLHEKIKLKGKVRMFEAFSGLGTQAMALKRVTDNYEIVGYSEIDKYAIQSYKAIHGEHIKNYGDITKMTEIPECDIFTWSFPCTDLSKAGKQAGMNVGTRSGLVYEVLRLVKDTKIKPRVLIMENVVDLIQVKFSRQFGDIQLELERMGYMNYVDVLNAKDHGVAQNRERVFMVSILGEYSYEFPRYEKLEKRLKDYLEPVVDEKYYLSDKQLAAIENPKYESMGIERVKTEDDVCNAITTIGGGNREPKIAEVQIVCNVNPSGNGMNGKVYGGDLAPTLTTNKGEGIKILEATNQGYALAEDGDGVYINRPHQKRGVVQKGMIQTIKTNGDDVGVVTPNMKIRKLTPREYGRLMNISDDDIDKILSVVSNSQAYKQFGNAIVVRVFEKILKEIVER